MKRKFYIGVDSMADKDNLDFELMTEQEIKAAEAECGSVWEYLTDYPMQNWFEIDVSAENLAKLKEMVSAMEKELR